MQLAREKFLRSRQEGGRKLIDQPYDDFLGASEKSSQSVVVLVGWYPKSSVMASAKRRPEAGNTPDRTAAVRTRVTASSDEEAKDAEAYEEAPIEEGGADAPT